MTLVNWQKELASGEVPLRIALSVYAQRWGMVPSTVQGLNAALHLLAHKPTCMLVPSGFQSNPFPQARK